MSKGSEIARSILSGIVAGLILLWINRGDIIDTNTGAFTFWGLVIIIGLIVIAYKIDDWTKEGQNWKRKEEQK